MKKISFTSGFTLVELLVVIAIIGILTAIITTNFATARSRSRDAKRVSDVNQIQLALEQAFDKCSAFPADITNTGNNVGGTCSGVPFSYFISVVPKDPLGSAYTSTVGGVYDYSVSGTDYVIRAKLENTSTALADAPSGTILNLVCDHASAPNYYYCVQPK